MLLYASRTDEGDARFRIDLLGKVGGAFGQNDLTCGPDDRFDEMAAVRGAVLFTHHNMGMNGRLIVFKCDIADHGQELNLLVEFHRRVVFLVIPIKPAEFNC